VLYMRIHTKVATADAISPTTAFSRVKGARFGAHDKTDEIKCASEGTATISRMNGGGIGRRGASLAMN